MQKEFLIPRKDDDDETDIDPLRKVLPCGKTMAQVAVDIIGVAEDATKGDVIEAIALLCLAQSSIISCTVSQRQNNDPDFDQETADLSVDEFIRMVGMNAESFTRTMYEAERKYRGTPSKDPETKSG